MSEMIQRADSELLATKHSGPSRKAESPVQFATSMICTLVIALFILTFNLQAFEIPTGSMERTLLIGDHLLVNRADVAAKRDWLPILPHHTIQRGEILVFLSPAQPELHLVKRVIGISGDHIRLEHGVLIRNGQTVREPYIIRDGDFVPYRDDFPSVLPTESDGLIPSWQSELRLHVQDGELVVPPGSYFVMGDNRDNSYDSRYWGFVPQENVIGRPLLIYWSFEESSGEYLETSPGERLSHLARVLLHFFDQTRWNRMLKFPS